MSTFCKGDLLSGIHGVDFGCTKSKVKEKSQAGGLGLDVGQENRTRINLLCLRLLSFLRFISFYASLYFNVNHPLFEYLC